MISEILTKIKAILDNIDSIASVYHSIEPRQDIEYPCVMFEPDSLTNDINDTDNNSRTLRVEIALTQEMEQIPVIEWETKRSSALFLLENVYTEIINEFDKDFTLTWTCDQIKPIQAIFGEAVHQDWNILFVKFNLDCQYTYNIKI